MKNKEPRERCLGRHPLTIGALALLGLAGYELYIRAEDFWAWTAGVRRLSAKRGTPFLEDMAIILEAPEMRRLALTLCFLAAAMIFALVCLFRRNRPRGAWALTLLSLGLVAGGAALGLFAGAGWFHALKLAPLGLIAAGSAGSGAQRAVKTRRAAKARKEESEKAAVNVK